MTHALDRNVSMQTQLTNKHMNMLNSQFWGFGVSKLGQYFYVGYNSFWQIIFQ